LLFLVVHAFEVGAMHFGRYHFLVARLSFWRTTLHWVARIAWIFALVIAVAGFCIRKYREPLTAWLSQPHHQLFGKVTLASVVLIILHVLHVTWRAACYQTQSYDLLRQDLPNPFVAVGYVTLLVLTLQLFFNLGTRVFPTDAPLRVLRIWQWTLGFALGIVWFQFLRGLVHQATGATLL